MSFHLVTEPECLAELDVSVCCLWGLWAEQTAAPWIIISSGRIWQAGRQARNAGQARQQACTAGT